MESELSLLFGTLRNPHRLRILLALEDGEKSANALVEILGAKQPTVSHHLKAMRLAGLVNVREHGRFRLYSLRLDPTTSIVRQMARSRDLQPREFIYIWDLRNDTQEWYGGVDQALGFEEGMFPRTAEAWEELVHPEDRERVMEAAERHLQGDAIFNVRYRIRRQDGSYATWQDCGSAMRDEHGEPYKWVGMARESIVEER